MHNICVLHLQQIQLIQQIAQLQQQISLKSPVSSSNAANIAAASSSSSDVDTTPLSEHPQVNSSLLLYLLFVILSCLHLS